MGKHVVFAALFSLILFGCGQSKPVGIVAPSKPLSQAEEALLQQLEQQKSKDRQEFMAKHRSEIIGFASRNKTFGDRLNAVLGVKH